MCLCFVYVVLWLWCCVLEAFMQTQKWKQKIDSFESWLFFSFVTFQQFEHDAQASSWHIALTKVKVLVVSIGATSVQCKLKHENTTIVAILLLRNMSWTILLPNWFWLLETQRHRDIDDISKKKNNYFSKIKKLKKNNSYQESRSDKGSDFLSLCSSDKYIRNRSMQGWFSWPRES